MKYATEARITAHLLATARYIAITNAVLLTLSACSGGWLAAQLPLAAALLYCHIRIGFDRRVFQDFADNRYTADTFDQALAHTGLSRISNNRDMSQRIGGGLAWWRRSLYLTAAQFILLFVQAI